ncbi:MAG: hypothetical protein B7Y12_14310 [Rhizobiales bacterium 24-66-13]|jgi:hypothetical protein|uniref:hypothetical protein n=1 Tax=Roseixanthobacter finlandensis TaxID=3119922 RepID=UPI000BD6BF11|nr:MAG: hypothetical protein B7Z41_05670 [Rhizobiales bacterium 12-66-7]OYY83439.1 MAG: hypothetical protein B7Y61_10350 [Rhizobiales bacterium 35-66-30]OYZ73930.1 MAG: hypothetical protein B7Y12_14310 [Rhizobiales bacterium 24-66-13]OZB06658.1 MAG: hypothetical protein B7X67_10040 [Rhizobiales bacterium 39-66-18]HQS07606.1 hypothetical protein [Xanthobacteraceae bacterium]
MSRGTTLTLGAVVLVAALTAAVLFSGRGTPDPTETAPGNVPAVTDPAPPTTSPATPPGVTPSSPVRP